MASRLEGESTRRGRECFQWRQSVNQLQRWKGRTHSRTAVFDFWRAISPPDCCATRRRRTLAATTPRSEFTR